MEYVIGSARCASVLATTNCRNVHRKMRSQMDRMQVAYLRQQITAGRRQVLNRYRDPRMIQAQQCACLVASSESKAVQYKNIHHQQQAIRVRMECHAVQLTCAVAQSLKMERRRTTDIVRAWLLSELFYLVSWQVYPKKKCSSTRRRETLWLIYV